MTKVKSPKSRTGNHKEHVVALMRKRAEEREENLRKYDHDGLYLHYDSDNDINSAGPIFDSYYALRGSDTICEIMNFTSCEFGSLYGLVHRDLCDKMFCGRGKKTKQTPKDIFIMILVQMKSVEK